MTIILDFNYSPRFISIIPLGLSPLLLTKCKNRLITLGWVEIIRIDYDGTSYQLKSSDNFTTPSSFLLSGKEIDFANDAYCHHALNGSGAHVYEILHQYEGEINGLTISEISHLSGRAASTVRKSLNRLLEFLLGEQHGRRFIYLPPDQANLKVIAEAYSTAGSIGLKVERHRKDREERAYFFYCIPILVRQA